MIRATSVFVVLVCGCVWAKKTPGAVHRLSLSTADQRTAIPESNPINYGADPSGVGDSLQGFQSAIAAVSDSHGTVRIPPGRYSLSGSIHLQQVGVSLVGSGGSSQWGGTKQSFSSAATVIVPSGNFPAITWTSDPGGNNPAGWWSVIRDIAILGNAAPLTAPTPGTPQYATVNNQHGIVVDCGGLLVDNVSIANMGGHGLLLRHSVQGHYNNVHAIGCHGDGLHMDADVTKSTSQSPAITLNLFTACGFTSNGGDGVRMVMGATGNSFLSCDFEQNLGRAVRIRNDDPSRAPLRNSENEFRGCWEEVNGDSIDTSGINGGADSGNHFGFVHSTTPSIGGFPGGDIQPTNGNTLSLPSASSPVRLDQFFSLAITRYEQTATGPTTINWPDKGSSVFATLLSDASLTFTGARDSQLLFLTLIQGNPAGNSHVTWPDNVKWPRGVAPVLGSSMGNHDAFLFTYSRPLDIYYALYSVGSTFATMPARTFKKTHTAVH